jgi:hypothetical protein
MYINFAIAMNSIEDCLCRIGIIVFVLSIAEDDKLLCRIYNSVKLFVVYVLMT